jgi:hypothetical protein
MHEHSVPEDSRVSCVPLPLSPAALSQYSAAAGVWVSDWKLLRSLKNLDVFSSLVQLILLNN